MILLVLVLIIINASLMLIVFAKAQGKQITQSLCSKEEQNQYVLLQNTIKEYFCLFDQINQWFINHFLFAFYYKNSIIQKYAKFSII